MGNASRRRILGENYQDEAKQRQAPSALELKRDRQMKNKITSMRLDKKKFWEDLGFSMGADGTLRAKASS